ncbi:MAG: hypothetical protein MI920_11135, partial [Kiloniellales bacterium]|nr:hypothetical protein [Kiloniellales bacterium]
MSTSANKIWVGPNVPGNTLGTNGDYYFDNVLEKYYIKESGAWKERGSLRHPWHKSGTDVYFKEGSVGIGTHSPKSAVHIHEGTLLLTDSTKYTIESLGHYKDTSAGALLHGFQVVDDLVFIAYGTGGLIIANVSDPNHITVVHRYKPVGVVSVNGVHVNGTTAYVACGEHVHIVDIGNPYSVTARSTPRVAGAGATGPIHRNGRYIYVASGGSLRILDVEGVPEVQGQVGEFQRTSATLLSFVIDEYFQSGDQGIATRTVTGYLNYGREGLRVVDLSDPANPVETASYRPKESVIHNFRIQDGKAYLALQSDNGTGGGLEVVYFSGTAFEPIAAYHADYEVHDVAVESSNLVYVAGSQGRLELIMLSRQEGAPKMSAKKVKGATIDRLNSETINHIALRVPSTGNTVKTILGAETEGLEVTSVLKEGISAEFEGSVNIDGDLYLSGLAGCGLSVDAQGKVGCDAESAAKELYESRISPLIRVAGEGFILTAATTGKTPLKWDRYGAPTAALRTVINGLIAGQGFAGVEIDWVETWRLAFHDIDSIITNTGIAGNAYDIGIIKKALAWRSEGTGWQAATNRGWARQLGRYLGDSADNDIVIGSGAGAGQKLAGKADAVVLGSGSNKASIVIHKGANNRAGSVAIGHDASVSKKRALALGPATKADADDAVVIGSGIAAVTGSGVAAAPLTVSDRGAVMLGAGSNKPSIVIHKGAKDRAGSVAIGHDASVSKKRALALGRATKANADDAVVIGSGVDTSNPLTVSNPGAMVLGAGSNKPSIAIHKGAKDQAGSVAIGSGVAAAPPTVSDPGAVVLGAGSNKPSIAIHKGAKDRAGSVAIGHDASVSKKRALALGRATKANADD